MLGIFLYHCISQVTAIVNNYHRIKTLTGLVVFFYTYSKWVTYPESILTFSVKLALTLASEANNVASDDSRTTFAWRSCRKFMRNQENKNKRWTKNSANICINNSLADDTIKNPRKFLPHKWSRLERTESFLVRMSIISVRVKNPGFWYQWLRF